MSQIKRRHFLQFAGSTLAAMGLSQIDFFRQANQYAQVLAQNTTRKLALLIGINNYPAPNGLSGCDTDVDLQRELLIYRYGFNPKDIYEVRDEKATRQGILDAFEEHLINQAQPGDVVIFHYSGHGSRVQDADPNPGMVFNNQGFNSTLVPVDREILNSHQVRDIMGHTLFLLTSALATDQVTMVLDSCFSGGGLRGNTRIRAYPTRDRYSIGELPSQAEFDYQNRWLADKRVNLTPQAFAQKRKVGIAKGVAIGAALATQEAHEAPEQTFGGNLQAGVFTYLLTRYLWQLSIQQSIATTFDYLALSTGKLTLERQKPLLETNNLSSPIQKQPVYFLNSTTPAAEAVVNKEPESNEKISFWLGGVSPTTLITYEPGAKFDIIDNQGNAVGVIELTGRDHLQAVGKLLPGGKTSVTKGTLLREQIKGVPANLTLKVGMDVSLGNDLATVQQALQSMNRIEVLPVTQQQELDCVFGRMSDQILGQLKLQNFGKLPPENSFCLFNPDLTPIADSSGAVSESVTSAIARLRPRLKALLARKVLKAVLGDSNGSPLRVSADIIQDDQGKETTLTTLNSRGNQEAGGRSLTINIPSKPLKPDTNLYVQVQNNESKTLYVAILVISDSGEFNVLYPIGNAIDSALVEKGKSLKTPYPIITQGPAGYFELLVIASKDQLRDTLKAVTEIAKGRSRGSEPVILQEDEPLQVVNEILGDIARAGAKAGIQGIDTRISATLSTVIQVTD